MTLRALGGAPLERGNMGRLIYVDEAGTSDEATEPVLTVGGLLVHADTQLDKVYEGIAAIERMMPEEDRKSGLVLHPSFIYGGNGRFDTKRHPQWTEQLRWEILKELAQLPNRANILVTFAPFERASLPPGTEFAYPVKKGGRQEQKIEKNRTSLAQAIAYMSCILECDIWLRTNAKGENCMVIAEDAPDAKGAIRAVHRHHQDAAVEFPEHLRQHFPLRRVREDPSFQEKRQGNPLILADFIAFVAKRIAMKDAKARVLFDPWVERVAELSLTRSDLWPN